MSENYSIEQMVIGAFQIFKWKINLGCFFCGNKTECTTVFADIDGKLVASLTCEECFNKKTEDNLCQIK